MKFQNIIDMHTHSDNSFDGNHSVILLCESAFNKKAKAIAITDHCEIDSKTMDFRALTINSFVNTKMAQDSFCGNFIVMQGIELGQALYNKPLAEQILNDFDYDFVLGSIHNLKDMEDFYFLDYKQYDVDDLLTKYFECELELAKWNKFDSLAHLTYPFRYIYERENYKSDLNKFSELIDEILLTLVKNKKALEINTSGFFMKIGETLPNENIVKRFKELGGEYITVGSDAHYAEKICNGIEAGLELAQKCGFEYITIYQKREPVLIPIE